MVYFTSNSFSDGLSLDSSSESFGDERILDVGSQVMDACSCLLLLLLLDWFSRLHSWNDLSFPSNVQNTVVLFSTLRATHPRGFYLLLPLLSWSLNG